MFMKFVGQGIK